jgi:hypothetical protein
MISAKPHELSRTDALGYRIVAVGFGAIAPAAALSILLAVRWDVDAYPPWGWLAIAVVPLAACVLLALAPARHGAITRAAGLVLLLHGASMAFMFATDLWPAITGVSLWIDVLLLLAVIRPILGRPMGRLAKATIAWVGILFGFVFPLTLASGFAVMWRAETFAGDRPYCLQYAARNDGSGYEPARTFFDLSVLKMNSRFRFQYHGVLVIEGGAYNWSYNQQRFTPAVVGPVERFCNPSPHYARNLPVWSSGSEDHIVAAVGERHFVIPSDYRPRQGASSRVLRINAVAPDFAPYDYLTHRNLDSLYSEIEIRSVQYGARLAHEFRERAKRGTAKRVEPALGFERTEVSSLPGFKPAVLYTASNERGTMVRFIQCDPRSTRGGFPCRYMLVADGLEVKLHISDVSQSGAAEQGLARLMKSFETSPAP